MTYFNPAEAADYIGLPAHWDRERWVRTRCKNGEIRAKQISRGVWRISEKALQDFMEPPAVAVVQEPAPVEPVSFLSALTPGARSRVRSA